MRCSESSLAKAMAAVFWVSYWASRRSRSSSGERNLVEAGAAVLQVLQDFLLAAAVFQAQLVEQIQSFLNGLLEGGVKVHRGAVEDGIYVL